VTRTLLCPACLPACLPAPTSQVMTATVSTRPILADFDPLSGGFGWLLARASWLSVRLFRAERHRSYLLRRTGPKLVTR
jgi:hypothetical protein